MHSHLPLPASEDSEMTKHEPVLTSEVLSLLAPRPGSFVVDCTLGPGGHAEALLEAIAPDGRLLGIDRDPSAIALSSARLARFGRRFVPRHGDHRELRGILEESGLGPPAAILADLGISSTQLLDAARGFSFSADGPLDMRMDPTSGETAADLVSRLDERSLARLIRQYGEEPRARAIAAEIVRRREEEPIVTTGRLAAIVTAVTGTARPGRGSVSRFRRKGRIHPATRTFMAFRIAVNDEIAGLGRFVEDAVSCLEPGGRLAVISFHSLEDRVVKTTLRRLATDCVCPPGLPACACGHRRSVEILTRRPVTPSAEEIAANPRSVSAKLRVAERT